MVVKKTEKNNMEKADRTFVHSTSDTCIFFGVTRETLSGWAKKGAPKEGRGSWDIKKLNEWLGKGATTGNGEQKVLSDEARKLKADADFREIKSEKEKISLDKIQGDLIKIDDVQMEWASRILELKSGLRQFEKKIAPQIANQSIREVERVLRDEVYYLLESYSRDGAYTPRKGKT
ncbi:hypothetical protein [Pelosinus sp. UFO1]|uniref:hypothetical protein n=1 Tax=Pelosinus sp. UFO1 TaxID=484770 RepID=UPI0004D1F80D|nr:hypothetical protein [Pelosinus sp. UFO1]AIF52012.1 hypothetical protein UFO1_2465 [Pelosinus sp. UFO1]